MKPYSPVPLCGIDVVIWLYLKQAAESKERQERMRLYSALAGSASTLDRYAAYATEATPGVR